MKTRIAVAVLIVLIAGVGIWLAVATAPPGPTRLVPAWQLLLAENYRAMGVLDPFLSWSPDSRSVIFSVFGLRSQRDKMFRWEVGEKKLQPIGAGASATYVTNDEFLYLRREPKAVLLCSLRSGKEREVASALKRGEFWSDVIGIAYNPKRRTIVARMAEYTQFSTPGTDEYDLTGKLISTVSTRLGEGIVDWSSDPTSGKSAILVQEKAGGPVSLQIVPKAFGRNARRGREIAKGNLTSVAWSPNGRTIAYSQGKIVVAVRPDDFSRVIVARFGDPDDESDKRTAVRLIWSPNSQYLAVFVYVPSPAGDYPLYYVLDMSKLKWQSE